MKCTKCGNELVEGAKFCTRCGNKIVYSHVENNVQENKVEEKNQSEWKEDKGENGSDKKENLLILRWQLRLSLLWQRECL